MSYTVSVVIPFYNENENIKILIKYANEFFLNKEYNTELIFIDDGSIDSSSETLAAQSLGNYSAKLIRLSKNNGSHAAFRAGVSVASGDFTIGLPADLQDPLELIDNCFELLKTNNYDVVFAHRKSTNNSRKDTFFSKNYAKLIQKYVAENFPDNGFDIVMFNTKIKNELNKNIETNSSVLLQILTLGFKQTSISYEKRERINGQSKWSFSKKIKLLIDSFVAFSYAPIRLVSLTGILFFMFGIMWTIFIASRKLLFNDVASGWPALTSILLLGFGITNIGLGIVAEYLWRTLDASRNRPVFIIDEVVDLKI